MEELTTFRAIVNGVVFLALFGEVALLTLVRDRCNWVNPCTAELRPIVWLVVINAVGITLGMVYACLSVMAPLTLFVSTLFMGRTIWRWEKNVDVRRGSF
ncbi:hypothetical protein pEaSNUABM11_00215 [Erwinia phage pEa_SNUABM_11]|nr:hypothetical protein pEaSNUABM11_00215 [Erwinia phage pEa_SNUABM_11]